MGGLISRFKPKKKQTVFGVKKVLEQLVDNGFVDKDTAKWARLAERVKMGGTLKKSSIQWLLLRDGHSADQIDDWIENDSPDMYDALDVAAQKAPDINELVSYWQDDLTPNAQKRTVLYINPKTGEKVLYQLDDFLYQATTGFGNQEMDAFLGTLRGMQEWFKAGAAGANTLFAGVNALGDWFTYQGRAKYVKGVRTLDKPWSALAQYLAHKVKRRFPALSKKMGWEIDDAFVDFVEETGGKLYTRLGDDMSRKRVRKQMLAKSLGSKVKAALEPRDAPGRLKSALQEMVSWSDLAPRLAEGEAAINEDGYFKEGGKWRNVRNGRLVERLPEATRIKAGLAMANATINFKRGGAKAGKWEIILPFSRAQINAIYHHVQKVNALRKMLTGAADPDELKEAQRYAVFLAVLAAGEIAYWLYRYGDDDYQEQDEHQRHRYWTFGWGGKTRVRIPKPRDEAFIGSVIGGVLDDWVASRDAGWQERFRKEVAERTPQPGGWYWGMLEAWFNYNSFRGRQITSDWMSKRKNKYQYDEYTRDSAVFISEHLTQYIGWNPKETQHVLESMTGGAYGRWTETAGGVARTIRDGDVSKHLGWKNVPYVGRILIDRHQSRSRKDFWDEYDGIIAEADAESRESPEKFDSRIRKGLYADYDALMSAVRKAEPRDDNGRRDFSFVFFEVGLAREAMGREPMEHNPSPFTIPRKDLRRSFAKRQNAWLTNMPRTSTT